MRAFLFLTFTFTSFFAGSAFALNEVANGTEIREQVGTSALAHRDLSQVKVAVLDNGFLGYQAGKGMLPESAELVEGPLKFPQTSGHGLGMAQILWESTGKNPKGPKFYLINSNGFTNFKAAVDFVIKNKVDIVLYSQIWTFGSHFDGKGFINEVVNEATDAGIIWINAAGNLGRQVFNGTVASAPESIELINKLDDNSVTLTLSWNDFGQSEKYCTTKDLDFEIRNVQGSLLKSGSLVQNGTGPDLKDPKDNRSCHARETISVGELERGSYFIKLIPKGNNFGDGDIFRIVMTENKLGSLEFAENTAGLEIMPPADNPSVFTVGEKTEFSAMGPTSDGRIKPDVMVESAVVAFTNGTETRGSSNAAAMVAGAVAHLKSALPEFNGKHLIEYAKTLRTQVLIPAGLIKLNHVTPWLQQLVPNGGSIRQDPGTYRVVILSRQKPTDLPLVKRFNLRLRHSTDIVACLENMSFCQVFPKEKDYDIKPPLIEFRQYKNGSTGNRPGVWAMPVK